MQVKRYLTTDSNIVGLWNAVDENGNNKYAFLKINWNLNVVILDELKRLIMGAAKQLVVSELKNSSEATFKKMSVANQYSLMFIANESLDLEQNKHIPVFELKTFESVDNRILLGLFYTNKPSGETDLVLYYDVAQQPYQDEDNKFFNLLFRYLDSSIDNLSEFEVEPPVELNFKTYFNKQNYDLNY